MKAKILSGKYKDSKRSGSFDRINTERKRPSSARPKNDPNKDSKGFYFQGSKLKEKPSL